MSSLRSAMAVAQKLTEYRLKKIQQQNARPQEIVGMSFSSHPLRSDAPTRDLPLPDTYHDKPLDATHLILLALNERCRELKRGCFYHLPLRSDITKGHPSDLVFVDEPWYEIDTTTWDSSTPAERLEMCDARTFFVPFVAVGPKETPVADDASAVHTGLKLDSHEYVIPVCCRILNFELPATLNATNAHQIYTSSSDPVVEKHSNAVAWSRPLTDLSRVLLLYQHQHSMAVLCHTTAAERKAECQSFPTPNDLSETYLPHRMNAAETVFGRASEQSPSATASRIAVWGNNKQVVLALLALWNEGRILDFPHPVNYPLFREWEKEWGCIKFLWQELDSRIKDHDLEARKTMLDFWPKE